MPMSPNPVHELQDLLAEQMKAQSEVSARVRRACGTLAKRLRAQHARLTESPAAEGDDAFELNLLLEAETGKAIAECRVFTGLDGAAYFDDGREPVRIDAPTQESFERALADFSERALKAA